MIFGAGSRAPENIQAKPFISALAGVSALTSGPKVTKPPQSATCVTPEFEAYVSLKGLIDQAAEAKRLEKQLAEKQKHLQSIKVKLENAGFIAKAPADVMQQQHGLATELEKQIKVMEENLRDLEQT